MTLIEMNHCLLHAKYLLIKFWDKVVYYANYFPNLVPTRVISSMTLVGKWCGKNPLVDHLRISKCISWEHIFDAYIKKLDVKSHACIMMVYSEESESYRLFDLVKQKIIIKRNMIFDEKSSGIKLLNPSYSLLHSDSFDICL